MLTTQEQYIVKFYILEKKGAYRALGPGKCIYIGLRYNDQKHKVQSEKKNFRHCIYENTRSLNSTSFFWYVYLWLCVRRPAARWADDMLMPSPNRGLYMDQTSAGPCWMAQTKGCYDQHCAKYVDDDNDGSIYWWSMYHSIEQVYSICRHIVSAAKARTRAIFRWTDQILKVWRSDNRDVVVSNEVG